MGKTYKDMGYRWDRVPSFFKRLRRKSRRSKERLALRMGKEIPVFKTSDMYDYL